MVAPIIQNSPTARKAGNGTSQAVPSADFGTISNGDLMIIVISIDGSGDDPSVSNDGSGAPWVREFYANLTRGVQLAIFTKIAASESGDYTINWDSTEGHVAFGIRITGHITSYLQQGTANQFSTSPSTALSMIPDSNNVLVLAFHGIDRDRITDGQADGGTGWTTWAIEEFESSGGTATGISQKNVSSQTASLDSTQALSTDDGWHAIQWSIRSESPSGVVSQFINQDGDDKA